MKYKSKLLYIIAISVMMIVGLTSCSDDNNDAPNTQPEDSVADYTVILWLSGGGNLDPCTLSDLNNMILMRENGTIGKNVNVVGSMAVSRNYQDALEERGIADVFSFELGEKRGLSSDTINALEKANTIGEVIPIIALGDDENVKATADLYDLTLHSLTYYADSTDTNMDKSADFATFIKKAAAKHPAKNYVVYLVGHGVGYNLACKDGDFDGTNVNMNGISAAGVAKAIKDSGVKIQTVVFNACNMGALENFAILKESSDYIMASPESVISGYMSQFVAALSAAGNDAVKMKEEVNKVIDYYAAMHEKDKGNELTSNGFYDMSYFDQLMASVKLSSQWFANANVTNETFMQNVVEGTIFCQEKIPDEAKEKYKQFYASRKAIREMLNTDPAKVSQEQFAENLADIIFFMKKNYRNYYCFGDMLKTALDMKNDEEAKGLDFTTLQNIYDQYMSTLHKMAYIKCSFSATEDDGYLYCSPSVNLFAMNEEWYTQPQSFSFLDENSEVDTKRVNDLVNKLFNAEETDEAAELMQEYFGGTWYSFLISLEDIESRYTTSKFDKMTGWSQVLKTLPSNPIYMINPLRFEKSGVTYVPDF